MVFIVPFAFTTTRTSKSVCRMISKFFIFCSTVSWSIFCRPTPRSISTSASTIKSCLRRRHVSRLRWSGVSRIFVIRRGMVVRAISKFMLGGSEKSTVAIITTSAGRGIWCSANTCWFIMILKKQFFLNPNLPNNSPPFSLVKTSKKKTISKNYFVFFPNTLFSWPWMFFWIFF